MNKSVCGSGVYCAGRKSSRRLTLRSLLLGRVYNFHAAKPRAEREMRFTRASGRARARSSYTKVNDRVRGCGRIKRDSSIGSGITREIGLIRRREWWRFRRDDKTIDLPDLSSAGVYFRLLSPGRLHSAGARNPTVFDIISSESKCVMSNG